jgi:endonuclease YncB( thermonuclease family)
MQLGRSNYRSRRPPQIRYRRSRIAYVRLGLLILLACAVAYSQQHARRWRSVAQNEPFPPVVRGLAEPIDGDSLWVGNDEIRLKGIDAPEWKQSCRRHDGTEWKCGEAAREEVARLIGNSSIKCDISERDRYGRMLGDCSADGRDLNAHLVRSGMAIAYGAYDGEQRAAREAKLGMWAGEFVEPRFWRAEHKGSDR